MNVQSWTFLLVAASFALYIAIAVWSRASSTKDFYVAGTGVSPLAKNRAQPYLTTTKVMNPRAQAASAQATPATPNSVSRTTG